ncbi:cytochrome P450 [Novosphingobium fluoreni]|uniref:cytochrome P450 n=1 Tax=Novosphingobium fluoreni TaxID=1391222 RepID=UPI003DA0A1CF
MTVLPKLRDLEDATFSPFMEESLLFGAHDDPYPYLAELREKGPVLKADYRTVMGLGPDITFPADAPHYMLMSYEACSKALLTPSVFSNQSYMYNLGACFGRSVSTMDAPEHGRFRRIFQKVFLPQYVKEWGGSVVDPVVNELLETFIHEGKADLVNQFTLLYPFGVIYKQLDLPPEEGKIFHKLAVTQTLVSVMRDKGVEASDKLGEFFPRLIAQRRANPGDDLVSLLVQTEVDGEYLPEDVLVSFFRQLINAAGDTTYRGTSVLLANLLKHPDQMEALRQDRSLLPNAIEEALRFDGPVLEQSRWTTTDIDFFGTHIPAGSLIHVMAGSANRDPAKFDNPDVFDIRRPNANRHLSFSGGPHICIGQHLARVEMTRAINAILDRLPNLKADPDMPPAQLKGAMMRVPHHLHVTFDPS